MNAIHKFKAHGLTEAQIAARLGITRVAVNHYANDKRFPGEETVRRMVVLAGDLHIDLHAVDLLTFQKEVVPALAKEGEAADAA